MISEWPLVRLGDLISLKGGLTYKGKNIGSDGAVLLGMGVVSNSESFLKNGIRRYTGAFSPSHFSQPGDLIIATRQQSDNLPILGFPAIVPTGLPNENVIVGTNLYKVTNLSDIENSFLYWLLRGKDYQKRIIECTKGTSVRMITKDAIEDFYFLCPPENTRKEIVNFLNAIDQRINLLSETNSTLEVIAQTLFKSWFVDFDPVREKQQGKEPKGVDKITASLFPDSFEKSELGEIPKGWKIKKISSIISESTKCVENNLPTVLSAIQTGNLVRSSDYFNKRIYSINISKYKAVPPFYFAYNPARINIGSIGINETKELGAVSPVYIVAEPISNYFGYYLWHHLKTSYMKEMIKNLASGSVRQILSYDDFSNIPLVFASEGIIKTFFNIRSEIYEGIKSNQTTIKTLVNLKQILLPNLLSGQLRPPALEETSNKSGVNTQ